METGIRMPRVHDTLNNHLAIGVGRRPFEANWPILSGALAFLDENLTLSSPEILRMVDQLSVGKSSWLWRRIVNRVRCETRYFHELEETGAIEPYLTSFSDGQVNGLAVRYASRERFEGTARYHPYPRRIEIKSAAPRDQEIVFDLLTNWRLNESVASWNHEHGHSLHFPENQRELDAYLATCDPGEELIEVHSYRMENPGSRTREQIEKEILDPDIHGNRFYPYVKRERLKYALVAINQLDALGFTPQQIGQLIIRCTQWQTSSYPVLDEAIDQKLAALGLSRLDLYTLVDADEQERQIDRLHAVWIAEQELKVAVSKRWFN